MKTKCTKGELCNYLDLVSKEPGDVGCGLFKIKVLNHELNKVNTIGVKYVKDKKDKGLALNVCPFCGEKINWFIL